MTRLPLAPAVDPCQACVSSAAGCRARQAGRAGRCCWRCTHDTDPEETS